MADERAPPPPLPPQSSGAGVVSATANAADSCRTVLIIECWFFDQEPILQRSSHQGLTAQYTALKLAPPHGPQFQLKLYAMKKYQCSCRRCGHQFNQLVQKGVDNGIATKALSLAYENICDRFILFAGDGDFYDSLNLIKNVLRKDLWVVGYRNTVSADLQQLASHVIWVDEMWSEIKMPVTAGTITRHHSDEDVADSDDQSTLYPQKRGKYRQVQLISQKPPPGGDRHQRRDRSQSRPRNGAVQQPPVDLGNEASRVVMPAAAPATTTRAEKRLARRRGLRTEKHRRNGEPISSKEDTFGQDPRPNDPPRPGILGVGPRGNGGNGGNEAREEEGEDRKAPTAPLSFALSDVSSSEEDEAFPETKRKQITVIDLASDTESD
uniref:NYN domain-containing protein n=1 Tax=Globisporangium ultimum (strain ATCC 200006 / CBS 805.95 / DAOM BR144) TaxID=431595 RepID=K3WPN1_GLOUD